MIDFKKDLNPSQLAAVMTVNGPALVIAGAGSGKTRV
ncbi:MAG: UvrD-helicase domain-containing protein, partial [Candidatus Omnitrophica bacterium]|nr:UvrD-helicase domain-containing protein [Candidatus Omnitrophota bacterium]